MIKMRCTVICDECDKEEGMTIDVVGDLNIGKERTIKIKSIELPEGWREHREDHYYGAYDDKILCAKCHSEKKKRRW